MPNPGDMVWIAAQVTKARFEPHQGAVIRDDRILGVIVRVEGLGVHTVQRTYGSASAARGECVRLLLERRKGFLDQAKAAGKPKRSDAQVSEIDSVIVELQAQGVS